MIEWLAVGLNEYAAPMPNGVLIRSGEGDLAFVPDVDLVRTSDPASHYWGLVSSKADDPPDVDERDVLRAALKKAEEDAEAYRKQTERDTAERDAQACRMRGEISALHRQLAASTERACAAEARAQTLTNACDALESARKQVLRELDRWRDAAKAVLGVATLGQYTPETFAGDVLSQLRNKPNVGHT
jgi:hypothetical protein